MSGLFLKGEKKERAGVYRRHEQITNNGVASAMNGVFCIPVHADFGPVGEVQKITSKTDLYSLYMESGTIDAAAALFSAGANTVYLYRLGTGGKEGSVSLQTTTSTNAVTLKTKYPTALKFSVTLKQKLGDATTKELSVYNGATLVEKVSFVAGTGVNEAANLVEAMKDSKYLYAELASGESGIMQTVTQQALTDGAAPNVTTEDYSNAFNAFEAYAWNVMILDTVEEDVKTLAKKMFMIVAEAESKAHGLPIEEVHFHEVGAIDSIVDIISVAVCVDNLGVDDIVVSELYEGSGHVHCQHGMMPVPVPATANIVAANHLPMKITDAQGEMVTPTGAAIAAALRTQDHLPEDYQLLKIGLGAGKKNFPKANVLRAMLLETKDQPQTGEEEDIWKLESNIDDCSGEVLGYTMERLLAAGARDVCYAPIYMKKNRPAYMLHVLCDRRQIPAMEEIIFNETTTIGIRRYKVERTILKRHEAKAKTAYGEVELKICEKNGIVYRYPEYESVKKLCEAAGVPFKVVYQAACEAEISE